MKKHIVIYKCDPSKNVTCKKTLCGSECNGTSKREYAQLDENCKPIVVYDSENPPPLERRRKRPKN